MPSPTKDPRRRFNPKRLAEYWYPRMSTRFLSVEDMARSCFRCGGNKDTTPYPMQMAHIEPRAYGGTETIENVHMLCYMCHVSTEHLRGEQYWKTFQEWTTLDYMLMRFMFAGGSLHKEIFDENLSVRQEWLTLGEQHGTNRD